VGRRADPLGAGGDAAKGGDRPAAVVDGQPAGEVESGPQGVEPPPQPLGVLHDLLQEGHSALPAAAELRERRHPTGGAGRDGGPGAQAR
jgi:hypothetical protein